MEVKTEEEPKKVNQGVASSQLWLSEAARVLQGKLDELHE
jgi:hypothetical protein